MGPLLSEIKSKIEFSENDSLTVREVKRLLAADMSSRYQDTDVVAVLNIASFLDPRFKTLAHLPCSTQEETIEKLKDAMLDECGGSSPEIQDPQPHHTRSTTEATVVRGQATQDLPAAKRKKPHPLEKLLGSKFQDRPSGSSSPSRSEAVSSEIGRYKVEKPIELRERPLSWWKVRRDTYVSKFVHNG